MIPSLMRTGEFPTEAEMALVRAIKSECEERFAIAQLFPKDRTPRKSDFTPEILGRLTAHVSRNKRLYGELHKTAPERFDIVMDILIIAITSRLVLP